MDSPVIRPVSAEDNAAVAEIIRRVMTEKGAGGAGFAIHDPEVNSIYEAYSTDKSRYFVIDDRGVVKGGAGVAPLRGADKTICELQKMYLLPELRGQGWGERLLRQCLLAARQLGYKKCYLETIQSMVAARRLYEKMGFVPLEMPLGDTGHFGCNQFLLLDLAPPRVRLQDERSDEV